MPSVGMEGSTPAEQRTDGMRPILHDALAGALHAPRAPTPPGYDLCQHRSRGPGICDRRRQHKLSCAVNGRSTGDPPQQPAGTVPVSGVSDPASIPPSEVPAAPDATDRKRPAEPDADAEEARQKVAKRPKRRGKGRKNYAALESGDGGSSGAEGEGEGGVQGVSGDGKAVRPRLPAQRDKDESPSGPQQLSKKDAAAQMTLSEDRRSVTSRLGYRTVRFSALPLLAMLRAHTAEILYMLPAFCSRLHGTLDT